MIMVLFLLAWNLYPVSDGDAPYFVPAAKWYARDGQLVNKLIDFTYYTDQVGKGLFMFYPPAFTFLLGKLASISSADPSYQTIFLWLAAIRSIGILFFAFVIFHYLSRHVHAKHYWLLTFFGLLLIATQSLYLLPANGRGEILAMTIVSTAIAVEYFRCRGARWINSLLIASIFAISIANGVIAILLYAIYLTCDERSLWRRIRWILLTGILAILYFVLSYQWAGIDLRAGLEGVRLNAKMQLGRTDTSFSLLFSYWKSWVFFALLGMMQSFTTLRRLVRWKPLVNIDSFYLVACIVLLTGAVHLFALRTAPSHYSIYAFLPLFQFLSFLFLADSLQKTARTSFAALTATSLAVLMTLPTPIQALITLPYYFSSGRTYPEAKAQFTRLAASSQCSVMYSNGLYALDDQLIGSIYSIDQKGLATSRRVESEDANTKKGACRLLFVQELNSNAIAPPGSQLLYDFSDHSAYLNYFRKLRLINSPKGYSFRVYQQSSAP